VFFSPSKHSSCPTCALPNMCRRAGAEGKAEGRPTTLLPRHRAPPLATSPEATATVWPLSQHQDLQHQHQGAAPPPYGAVTHSPPRVPSSPLREEPIAVPARVFLWSSGRWPHARDVRDRDRLGATSARGHTGGGHTGGGPPSAEHPPSPSASCAVVVDDRTDPFAAVARLKAKRSTKATTYYRKVRPLDSLRSWRATMRRGSIPLPSNAALDFALCHVFFYFF
jgi:hypothetical protein